MDDKKILLNEIASLIEADTDDNVLDLGIMEYMNFEELVSIRDSLQNKKNRRKQEQEKWYDEWVEKCGI
ncbi:MAG: hypothetical protein LBS39_03070 [Campylobacteraceae bacterium]|jgi:hypothetical protein|nr:hypothetical protein [Campylobacteraceae bacterium]